jgi:biopolymer transport protein TolR
MQLGTRHGRGRRLNSEINVTPFVDVMLVLLVIFMVTSPMLVAGVPVDLPQTSAAPLGGQDEPLVLTIDSKGNVYLQEFEIPFNMIAEKLSAIAGAKADTRIFIRGDRSLQYGKIMTVFNEIKKAGYQHVALVTEVEN